MVNDERQIRPIPRRVSEVLGYSHTGLCYFLELRPIAIFIGLFSRLYHRKLTLRFWT